MSPLKKHITVRSGHILGHFDSVELAADFVQRLDHAKTVHRPHDEGSALPEIDFAGEAKSVIDCATMCVHHFGVPTVAKGFQKFKLPSHLHRSVRELDAASSLLRHPGASLQVLADLKSWLSTNPRLRQTPSASASPQLSGSGGSLTSSGITADGSSSFSSVQSKLSDVPMGGTTAAGITTSSSVQSKLPDGVDGGTTAAGATSSSSVQSKLSDGTATCSSVQSKLSNVHSGGITAAGTTTSPSVQSKLPDGYTGGATAADTSTPSSVQSNLVASASTSVASKLSEFGAWISTSPAASKLQGGFVARYIDSSPFIAAPSASNGEHSGGTTATGTTTSSSVQSKLPDGYFGGNTAAGTSTPSSVQSKLQDGYTGGIPAAGTTSLSSVQSRPPDVPDGGVAMAGTTTSSSGPAVDDAGTVIPSFSDDWYNDHPLVGGDTSLATGDIALPWSYQSSQMDTLEELQRLVHDHSDLLQRVDVIEAQMHALAKVRTSPNHTSVEQIIAGFDLKNHLDNSFDEHAKTSLGTLHGFIESELNERVSTVMDVIAKHLKDMESRFDEKYFH